MTEHFIDSFRVEAGAMTLFERLNAWQERGKPTAPPCRRKDAQAVVDRWRKAVAGGNNELFDARLGWDGLDEEGVIGALSWTLADPESAASLGPNCGWFKNLETDFHMGLSLLDDRMNLVFLDWAEDLSVPFVELWAPWVVEATAMVARHTAVTEGRISDSAVHCLSQNLLLQIGELGSESAFFQFNRRRSVELSALDDRSGDQLYRRWVREQLKGGLAPLFEEFPVLARQMYRLVETWKETTVELFERVENDWQALAVLLRKCPAGPSSSTMRSRDGVSGRPSSTGVLGPLVAVRPGLSDRHYGGRRVAVLVFEGGEEIVYKPRSLAMEGAFAAFLHWLEAEGLKPVPRVPEILLRRGYGWMEVVQPADFVDAEQVRLWFNRAGVLMCLAYILGGSDLHVDNVMAGRESPVLIDLETLLHPELASGEASCGEAETAVGKIFDRVQSSFLATGMLTFLQEGPDGQVIDIGGLCGTGGHDLGVDALTWRQRATDGLHKVKQQARAKDWCNVPRINGKPQTADAYGAEIESGFSTAYRLVIKHRAFLRSPQGVQRWFAGLRTRVLLRPTYMYARVLQFSIRPAHQRNGMNAGVFIEALNRHVLEDEKRPPKWDLAVWERQALEGLDIPHLTLPVDAVDLEGFDGSIIEGVISASGLELFRQRLDGLSEEDLEQQVRLMALSLEAQGGGTGHTLVASSESDMVLGSDQGRGLSQDVLLQVARSIADELVTRAIVGGDHSLIWLDPMHIRPEGRLDRGVSYYLYSGSAGIALFFAAMARVFPNRSYREAAEGALRPIVTVLNDHQTEIRLANEGLGGCHGLGGIVYALALASDFLDQPDYLRLARQVVGHITPERIASDQTLDVEGGSAGAILGLLAMQDVCPDDGVLDAAALCARHLVAKQQLGPEGGAAWPSRQGGMLAGFAHGASGIALALVRLWRWVRDPSLLDAAERAMEFEDSLFDSEKKNWPLVLFDATTGRSESRNMSAWCHGAPGIALARASMLDLMPQARADDMLDAALATTLTTSLDGPDHLCCGTLGRLEILFSVGNLLGRETLLHAVDARVSMVIQRASASGSFRLEEGRGPTKSGFFRGLAGIGYQMVRLCRPDEIPSVLAFQSARISRHRALRGE